MSIDQSALQLAKAKLKVKTNANLPSPSSAPSSSSSSHELDYEAIVASLPNEYDSSVHICNIENWIDLLGPAGLTPHTVFCPLSMEDCRDIMRIFDAFTEYQRRRKYKKDLSVEEDEGKAEVDDGTKGRHSGAAERSIPSESLQCVVPLSEASSFSRLLEKVQSQYSFLIHSLPTPIVFVKTSSRSAKNSVKERSLFLHQYRNEFKWWEKHSMEEGKVGGSGGALTEAEVVNLKMVSLVRAATYGLAFDNPEDILDILCKSRRIYDDFDAALEYHQGKNTKGVADQQTFPWVQNIVLREWKYFNPILEFRCFVHHHTLRAISQYTSLVYSPIIVRNREVIKEKIIRFVGDIVAALQKDEKKRFSSYVVDVGFTDPPRMRNPTSTSNSSNLLYRSLTVDLSTTAISDAEFLSSLSCIELNPYYFTTHGCMFEWNNEGDNEILTMNVDVYRTKYEGQPSKALPVMRIVESMGAEGSLLNQMDSEWREIIDKIDVNT